MNFRAKSNAGSIRLFSPIYGSTAPAVGVCRAPPCSPTIYRRVSERGIS
jgi:hypothetical protein